MTVTPAVGGPHTAFKLSFWGLLDGGAYGYVIKASTPPRCQREAERAIGGPVAINVIVSGHGQVITKTLRPTPHGLCPGDYRVYMSYLNSESDSPEGRPFATADFLVTG